MPGKETFPALVSRTTVGAKAFAKGDEDRQIFDVKFYPYATGNDDQIFAAVGGTNAFICRPTLNSESPFDILRWFKDDSSPTVSYNSLVWMKDPQSRKPLLCIAGSEPRHIKFIDVESGEVVRILSGHGRGINDLAVSPLSASLLTSAAEDYTIRIWNIEEQYAHQPCVAIFGGEGHREPILAIHYHPNGRWLLSGGIDTAVCLWAVPDPQTLERSANANPHKPMVVYYPYFYSKEVHPDYVDCLAFYGDLIISRAATDNNVKENEILIWKINGFKASDMPPAEPPIPTPGKLTRSGFPHDDRYRGFQRLLTLDMPYTDRFYRRFTLYNSPGARPILAMGSQRSEFHFWDLQLLEEGVAARADRKANKVRKGKAKAAAAAAAAATVAHTAQLAGLLGKEDSFATDESRDGSSTPMQDERKFSLGDPFAPIEAHHIAKVKSAPGNKTPGQCSTISTCWSPDGTWFVAVGDLGMVCVFHRDPAVVRTASGSA